MSTLATYTGRRNARPQVCDTCGAMVPAGQGSLYYVSQDWLDDNDDFNATPGWKVDHLDRELCAREKAKADAEEAFSQAERAKVYAARRELDRIFRKIETSGEYPKGPVTLDGEEIFLPGSGRRIYGGGRWFVIDGADLWAVANNGMDGDDWQRNNVRTGGAGAIGHVLQDGSGELAAEIRRWHSQAGPEEHEL